MKNRTTDDTVAFDFGENWESYAQTISSEKIDEAGRCLRQLLGDERLDGIRFLDIGCGSGLHALAALKMGASVKAIDINERSVATTRALLSKYADDKLWSVEQADILTFDCKEQFDIVYSWGVLHHTGNMDDAIRRACSLVIPGGRLVIAVYKKTPMCNWWAWEKKNFNRLPKVIQGMITFIYSSLYLLALLIRRRNPVSYVRSYKTIRGMNFWHDSIDWLGGYPYESASPDEMKNLVTGLGFSEGPSFNTRPVAARGLFGSGCAEYVYFKNVREAA